MNFNLKRVAVPLLGVCVLGLISYMVVVARASTKPKKPLLPVSNAIAVVTTPVQKADMPQNVQALGSLEAVEKVAISAEDTGRVTSINFKNGQQVVKGMPLAQLDNVKATAEYQSAVTALSVSETKYRRSKLLLNEAVSQQELAQLQADVESNKADVQKAQSVLNNKQVAAPFTGVLGKFNVQVGDYVSAGDPIVTIVNTSHLRVDYAIPENNLPQLKTGQLVEVTVSAYPKKVFYGTVNYISPTVDPSTRSVPLQAVINNDKGLLSPGMFVHIKEQTSVTKGALVLPAEAIQASIKGYYVYLVQNDHAIQKYIKIGERKADQVQVASGLSLGDTVVSQGQQKLNDGSLIRVIPADG